MYLVLFYGSHGLKILVSVVRFRPWAPFKSLNIADCPKEIRVSRGFLAFERPELLQDATVSEPAIAENKGLYGSLSK